MRNFLVLIFVLAFAGCYTQHKAEKQVARAQITYPGILANTCATLYPPNILPPEYRPGKPETKSDTVYVEGKRIPCPPTTDPKTGKEDTFYVNCPPSVNIHDTTKIHDTAFIPYENTAKIDAAKTKNDDLNKQLQDALKQLNVETDSKNAWRNTSFVLGAFLGVGVFLKLKKII